RRHTRLQGDWSSDVCSSDLRRAILRIRVAVVRPRLSASIAAVSTLRARPSRLLRTAIVVSCYRCEMKNPTLIAELHAKLGAPSRSEERRVGKECRCRGQPET